MLTRLERVYNLANRLQFLRRFGEILSAARQGELWPSCQHQLDQEVIIENNNKQCYSSGQVASPQETQNDGYMVPCAAGSAVVVLARQYYVRRL